ncbi:hypothetical protein Q9Q99_06325 [Curtobacterium flaccumfaciens]|nr:hypothetical protein Q9Q99_06325 [Curtobacterium flaccumfaciens]
MQPVTLESARVRLDLPTRADTAAITEACQDPEIVRWTTVPEPVPRTGRPHLRRRARRPGLGLGP